MTDMFWRTPRQFLTFEEKPGRRKQNNKAESRLMELIGNK